MTFMENPLMLEIAIVMMRNKLWGKQDTVLSFPFLFIFQNISDCYSLACSYAEKYAKIGIGVTFLSFLSYSMYIKTFQKPMF